MKKKGAKSVPVGRERIRGMDDKGNGEWKGEERYEGGKMRGREKVQGDFLCDRAPQQTRREQQVNGLRGEVKGSGGTM